MPVAFVVSDKLVQIIFQVFIYGHRTSVIYKYYVSGHNPSSYFYLEQKQDYVQKHNICINVPSS
jgi:hypothetical protein